MATFLEQPISQLVPGADGAYSHWFGGEPTHNGAIPPDREYAVNLLYDLDLTDPQLGLASRFPGLSRLPLYNALQYNCCDIVYRVVADDAIEIVAMDPPKRSPWSADFPFENYPRAFPRTPIHLETVAPDIVTKCITPLAPDGSADIVRTDVLQDACMFPRVGGRQFMWQGIPEWPCPTPTCPHHGQKGNANKEVFAVIWERPIPGLHLWIDNPKPRDLGSCQIIFSRCTGCGVLHSCNRCD